VDEAHGHAGPFRQLLLAEAQLLAASVQRGVQLDALFVTPNHLFIQLIHHQ